MTRRKFAKETVSESQLAEVWGDIVDRAQLRTAIAIGAATSLAAFYAASMFLGPLASNASIGKAFAMLVGIVGALIGGVACSFLFPPKRKMGAELSRTAGWQILVLEQIEQEEGAFGSLGELPPGVAEEMHDVGLYEVFRSFEQRRSELKQSA